MGVGLRTSTPLGTSTYHYQMYDCQFNSSNLYQRYLLTSDSTSTLNYTPIYVGLYRNQFNGSNFNVLSSGMYTLQITNTTGCIFKVTDSSFANSSLNLQGTGTGALASDFSNTIQYSSFNQSTYLVNPSSSPTANAFLIDKSIFFNSSTGLSSAPSVNFTVQNCNFSGFNSSFGSGTRRSGTSEVKIYNAEIVNNQATFNFNSQDLQGTGFTTAAGTYTYIGSVIGNFVPQVFYFGDKLTPSNPSNFALIGHVISYSGNDTTFNSLQAATTNSYSFYGSNPTFISNTGVSSLGTFYTTSTKNNSYPISILTASTSLGLANLSENLNIRIVGTLANYS